MSQSVVTVRFCISLPLLMAGEPLSGKPNHGTLITESRVPRPSAQQVGHSQSRRDRTDAQSLPLETGSHAQFSVSSPDLAPSCIQLPAGHLRTVCKHVALNEANTGLPASKPTPCLASNGAADLMGHRLLEHSPCHLPPLPLPLG